MQDDSSKESGGRKGGDKDRKGQQSPHGHEVPDQLAAAQVAQAASPGPRFPKPVSVSFSNKDSANTPDEALWEEILARSEALSFDNYATFIDSVLCEPAYGPASGALADCDDSHNGPSNALASYRRDLGERLQVGLRTHLFGPDAYLLLQVATECFIMHNACASPPDELFASKYLTGTNGNLLPYLNLIKKRLAGRVGAPGTLHLGSGPDCFSMSSSRLLEPCFIELIWSYWHEQGMLVQAINAIAIRYQNIRQGARGRDPLAGFELDPLRPLNNILWGYLQEEHRRLSLVRRAYEYDHHYGLRLSGRAIPPLRSADSRSKFLPAFHELLYQAQGFFKDDDIATVQADAFPILNSLREMHFVLTEGMHNQFGDLPSQARVEMLMQQYLLSRTEIREFLRGRQMVPYPELWMDSVDTMKTLQGWTDVPVMYFNELAVTGEQLLISVRYANWSQQTITSIDSAANWARRFRPVIQRYLYAYRVVTGVDLAVDRVELQSVQSRNGQPPIRMRVGRQPQARARMMDGDDLDLLAPPAPRAMSTIDDVTLSPRPFNRSRRR